jgi:hypothetical protein
MKVKEPDFATVMSLVWRQAPALFVFGFIADLLLVSAVYMLPAGDHVLPSGALDTRWRLTRRNAAKRNAPRQRVRGDDICPCLAKAQDGRTVLPRSRSGAG